MIDYPCRTCTYRDTPYVCEQTSCEKYKAYKAMSPYEELGEIAKQTVIRTMMEGEATHPDKPVDGWKDFESYDHALHAVTHIMSFTVGLNGEDDIAHALTRCAMIKYLSR